MLARCGLTMESDDRIRVNTAGVLGLSPDEFNYGKQPTTYSTTYYSSQNTLRHWPPSAAKLQLLSVRRYQNACMS